MLCASFFAGCGGLDFGLRQAGINIIYANEIDAWACETYRYNIGPIVQADIASLDLATIPDVDLIVGGFPCQSFSHCGNRLGLNDARGTLFYNFANIVIQKQPKYVICENVLGLLTHQSGETFKTICNILNDGGYYIYHKVIDASTFGVPQKRKRVIIVCVNKNVSSTPFIFPIGDNKIKTVKEAIDDIKDSLGNLPNHEPMKHTARIIERFKTIQQGQSLKDVSKEHQQRQRGDTIKISGKTFAQNNFRMHQDLPSPTICASFQSNFIHYEKHRNITAREAARLQSFPDHFIFKGKRTTMSWEKNLSQYQQIGNAVPPTIGYIIGCAINEYDKQIYSS